MDKNTCSKLKNMTIIRTIDTHTEGEPTRLILNDSLKLKGKSINEKKKFFMKNYDYIRTALMAEPRGHKDMFGAILTDSPSSKSDFGLFFIDNDGYLPMCIHASIGTAVALNKLGLLNESILKKGKVLFETQEGIITSELSKSDDSQVTITNVPTYLIKEDVKIDTEKGILIGDIYYSGNYVYIVNPKQVGLDILLKNKRALVKLGMKIKTAINEKTLFDKIKKNNFKISIIEFSAEAGKNIYKNMAVFGNGQFDRSPCGTGSSAKLAQLFHKNKIGIKEKIIINSIIGTKFIAQIADVKKMKDVDLVIPKVTGTAYITAVNGHIIEKNDKLGQGFTV